MSPARQPNASPRRRKTPREIAIASILETERRDTIPPVQALVSGVFDPHAFLATIGEGRKIVFFPRKQAIFAQGDSADAVFYIRAGKVKLTVVSKVGKEATIGILGEGDFFGEDEPVQTIGIHSL
jgi:CRP-like cAMP-binding protein